MVVSMLGERNSQLLREISPELQAPQSVRCILDTLEDESSDKSHHGSLLRVFALLQLVDKSVRIDDSRRSEIQQLARLISHLYLSKLQAGDVIEGSEDNESTSIKAEAGIACLYYLASEFNCSSEKETLAHITAYTDPIDAWTTVQAASLAGALIKIWLPEEQVTGYIVDWILPQWLRPIFSSGATSKVTQSGRPSHFPEQAPRGFQALQRAAWKSRGLQVISTARWATFNSSEDVLREHWPLFTPVLLTISEDDDVGVRILGLTITMDFLEKCPGTILNSTGIGKVFEDVILPSVLYLPSLTPEEESVKIIRPAYEALVILARKEPDVSSPVRRALLDKVLRDGLLAAYGHASNYLLVVEVLMSTTTTVLDTLEIYSIKHLPNIFSMLSSILTDPFTAPYPSVLVQATRALSAAISNCWPRIIESGYDGEIIRVTATCWLNVRDGMAGVSSAPAKFKELDRELQRIQGMLRSLREVSGAAPPGGIHQVLNEEPRLKELLESGSN